LQARGIPGVILGPDVDNNRLSVSNHEAFALIQTGRSRHLQSIDRVAVDAFHAMTECMTRLKAAGYRRIGFLDGVNHSLRNERRWEAVFAISQAVSPSIPPLLVPDEKAFTKQALADYVAEWDLDALVSGRIQVYEWLRSDKAFAPIGFACPNLRNAQTQTPGVVAGFNQIGAAAAELLVDAIHAGRRGLPSSPRTISIAGNWHAGELAERLPR
jgi:LacI family transcriptional regulator